MLASGAWAQEVVTSFGPADTTDFGVWYRNDVRVGGTADTVDLTGLGGDLENGQPLPIGAALLTTDFTNEAKAEVGVADGYGTAEDILASLQLFYSYFKASNPGQIAFAAPSIKLTFVNDDCVDSAGDCYGTLTYEPYWNQPGSVGAVGSVPLDQWVDVSIDGDSGVFWWSGGFGQPNSFGGPPLLTLNDWLAEFSDDFPGSTLLLVSIGVGSFNQGQIGYFDDVEIVHDDYQAAYDFEPAIGPPEDKDACKNGGWMTFNNPSFRNQGDCVSFVVSNGKAQRQN
jgi:hypothetical protein